MKKIISLSFSFSKRKFYIDKIYVFIGEHGKDKELMKILKKISLNTDEKIPASSIAFLEKKFGKKWKELLGFSLKKIDVTTSKRELKGGSAVDLFEGTVTLDDLPESEIDLDDFLEDSQDPVDEIETKEPINLLKDVEENITIDIISSGKYIWVLNEINDFDTIITVKKKMYAYSGIHIIYQYLFDITSDIFFEDDLVEKPLGMKFSKLSWSGILGMEGPSSEKEVIGFPINENFMNDFENDNSKIINTNETNTILSTNTIYMVNFRNLIGEISANVVEREVLNNPYKLSLFYNGFVLMYFPGIAKNQIKSIMYDKYESIFLNRNTLKNNFDNEQAQIKLIESSSGPANYLYENITSCTLQHKHGEIINEDIKINLKNLFQLFELSDIVPFVSFKDKTTKKIYQKIDNNFYYNNIIQVEKIWKIKDVNGLLFRFRMGEKGSVEYDSFGTFNLYNTNGNYEINMSFNENDNMTIESTNKVLKHIVKKLIRKINSINNLVFYNDYLLFEPKTIDDLKVLNINSVGVIQMPEVEIRLLGNFLEKYFSAFFTKEPSDMSDGIYYRFIFSNNNLPNRFVKTTKTNVKNEVLYEFKNLSQEKEGELQEVFIDKYKMRGPELVISYRLMNVIDDKVGLRLILKGSQKVDGGNEIFKLISQMINVYLKSIKTTSLKKKNIKYSSMNKNVKTLQKNDPLLFNFKMKNENNFYSRLCQKNQQPNVYTDIELENQRKKMTKENKEYEYVLRFANKTYPNRMNNYVCEHHEYKYPGFLPSEKHPKGFCLPCCYKNSSIVEGTRKNRIYKNCTETSKQDKKKERDEELNKKYIKDWGKTIQTGRYGNLPDSLKRYFNTEENCTLSNINMLQKNNSCYLVAGISQSTYSIFDCISYVINYDKDLFNDCMKFLMENPWLFYYLNNGEIARQYSSLELYISYIREGGFYSRLKIEDVIDLIKKYLVSIEWKDIEKIEFVVMYENESGSIYLECNDMTFSKIVEEKMKIVILLNSMQKGFYYPIVNVTNKQADGYQVKDYGIFNSNFTIYEKMLELLKKACRVSSRFEKYENYQDNSGMVILPRIKDIAYAMDKIGLKYVIVNDSQIRIEGMLFPCYESNHTIGTNATWKVLRKVLDAINKTFGTGI